ncbi:MAG: YeeE/YedE family protein [Geothermobacteraceae bacterium]
MLRQLLLAIAVSMISFELVRQSGILHQFPPPLFGPPSLVNLFGGMIFGFGMVLAGGCVVGVLYKAGSGSLPALLALAGLLAGSFFYSFIHPLWLALAKALAFPTRAISLSELLGISPAFLVLPTGLALLALCLAWGRKGLMTRLHTPEGYIQPWQTACVTALAGTASLALVGMPLGITTSYGKLAASTVSAFNPKVVASLEYFSAVPLNYVPPFAGTTVTGGTGPAWDGIAAVQYPLIGGIFLGSAISAVSLNEWALRSTIPWKQAISATVGGVIMGFAARMAPACNIWHLLGGIPFLALQSLLFVAGLFPGAWLGSRMLRKLVMN